MVARFITILFLSAKLILRYFFLLITSKQKRGVLVLPSFGAYGGTKTYFISLIEFLSKNNFRISVMLKKNQLDVEVMATQALYPFTIIEQEFEVIPTKFTGTVFYKRNQEYFIYHLRELIYFWKKLRTSKCSQLIISEANPELLLSLLFSPVRVSYILHTVATHRLDDLKAKMLHISPSNGKQLITVSKHSKDELLTNWTDGGKSDLIKVVHNYYEPRINHFVPAGDKVERVLTIGTVTDYKNPFFWIDTCKELLLKYKDGAIEFIWAGDGDLLAACKDLVGEFPPIKFIGYQKNVEQLYMDCTLYFQPSILESQGIAVLGAMYFEKPCVVSNRQGLPETVIDHVTGLVIPIDSAHDAAESILSLLTAPERATAFGIAGKKRVVSHFGKNKWMEEMSTIFN